MPMFRRTFAASAAALFAALAGPAAAATFTWVAGAFVPGTTAPSPLLAPDLLNIQSGALKSFSGVSFSNGSTVNWEAGSIAFSNAASVSNSGLWDAQSDFAMVYSSGAASTFNNSGTLRKSAGLGTTQIGNSGSFLFVNSGTIEAQTGTLQFSGASTFNSGSVFTGAGSVVVTTGSTFNGGFSASNLTLANGQQTGNAALLNGQAQWAAGSLAGSWGVASAASLTLQSPNLKTFNGASVTNNGTVDWQQGSLVFNNGAKVVNAALWDAQSDFAMVYGSGAASTFNNSGTLRKSAGIGTTQIGNSGSFLFVNSGTIDAQTGTLQFSGASTFNSGSVFTGAGSVVVTTASTFNGGFTSSNLTLANGQQTGNAALLNGQAQWAAGSLAGSWGVATGATLTLQSPNLKTFNGASLTNDGTVDWQQGSLVFNNGTHIVNAGVWDATSDFAMVYSSGAASSFTNNGTLKKSGGSGTTLLSNSPSLAFVNNGTVDVQVGTIQLPGAFSNAGTLTGSGTLQSAGGLTNNGTLAPGSFGTGTLALTGGNLMQAAGAVFAVDLTNLSSFDLLTVAGSAALNGTLALNCLGACSFAVGDSFTILDATGGLSGSFSSVSLTGFASGAFNVVYDLPSASVRLFVTQAVSAVPEPRSWALMAAGLGALSFIARRRKPTGAALAKRKNFEAMA